MELWLQYDGVKCMPAMVENQLTELHSYLKTNPQVRATGFWRTTGDLFAKFVRLECEGNSLELSKTLQHLNDEPSNIVYSEYVTKKINDY